MPMGLCIVVFNLEYCNGLIDFMDYNIVKKCFKKPPKQPHKS